MSLIELIVNLEEHPWADISTARILGGQVIWLENPIVGVGCLPNGTESGLPAVLIRFDLPDGRTVVAQTTLALFQLAGKALTARYGDAP